MLERERGRERERKREREREREREGEREGDIYQSFADVRTLLFHLSHMLCTKWNPDTVCVTEKDKQYN